MYEVNSSLSNNTFYTNRLKEVLLFINNNLKNKLSVDKLAKFAQLSTSNFYKVFKKETGISPNEYIINSRLSAAKELLDQYNSVNEVAYETGFSDANYFIKVFKKIEGVTPKAYQLQHT